MKLPVPNYFRKMENAREEIKRHYKKYCKQKLNFPYDGLLLGDVGKALAATHFRVILNPKKRGKNGIQGYIMHQEKKLNVQIRATGDKKNSPIFGRNNFKAKHLLVFLLDSNKPEATVVYNGPMSVVRNKLGTFKKKQKQKQISIKKLKKLDDCVRQKNLFQLPRYKPRRLRP